MGLLEYEYNYRTSNWFQILWNYYFMNISKALMRGSDCDVVCCFFGRHFIIDASSAILKWHMPVDFFNCITHTLLLSVHVIIFVCATDS